MDRPIYHNSSRHTRRLRWFLAIASAATVIFLYVFNVFERLELLTLDYRFLLKNPKPLASEIVFIDMAEDSVSAIGRWPWPRKWHAVLTKILSDYHPKAIVFDVLFSEPQDEEDDAVFEEAIARARNVYLPLVYELKTQDIRGVYDESNILSVIEPIERFRKVSKATGHLNAIPDPDGVLRRVPPVISYDGGTAYQLGLRVGIDAMGLKDPVRFPLDGDRELIINWQGRWGTEAKHYSYIDVIKSYAALHEGRPPLIDLNTFTGKICLIGLTASGLIDIKPVPIEKAYPAAGINGMIINSVLTGSFIREVPRAVNVLLIAALSFLVTFYLARIRLIGGLLLAIVSIFGYALFSVCLFVFFNISILTFYPMLAIFLSYSLTSIYTQIMQTIERTQLFRLSTRDELTSLYNIRHFNILLESELAHALSSKSPRLALIMADLDHFKSVNDTYGHQAGDTVLKEAAGIIRSKCRKTDVAARYGGEEFIIMLAGAGEKEAFDIAEKIRLAVEEHKFRLNNRPYSATISLGIAEFSGERNKDELVAKADKALYHAKEWGRNKACLYSGCGR